LARRLHGYTGRVFRVDLTHRTITKVETSYGLAKGVNLA